MSITTGSIVRYRAAFLRSIGVYTGPLPWAVGEVVEVHPGDIAYVRWDTDEAPPHVRIGCLIPADKVWTEQA